MMIRGTIAAARMVCEIENREIDRAGPALSLKTYRADMGVIVEVASKKKWTSSQRGQHEGAMGGHASALDEAAADEKQHGARAVERALMPGKMAYLPRVAGVRKRSRFLAPLGMTRMEAADHAAGLVVRRFTITKHNPNMKSVNKTSVASDSGKENVVGLAG